MTTQLSPFLRRLQLWVGFFTRIRYPHDVPLVFQAFQQRRHYPIPTDVWRAIEPLGGFLSIKEAGLLYTLAKAWPVAGPVLELGSYEGKSTVIFAKAGRAIHAVDAWCLDVADLSAYAGGALAANSVSQRFQNNLRQAGVTAQVQTHQGLTHAVGKNWNTPGAILFVDAGHTYADVKGDLEIWAPFVLPGGVIIMHDVIGDTFLGVTRAASELLQQNWRVVGCAGSAVAFAKR